MPVLQNPVLGGIELGVRGMTAILNQRAEAKMQARRLQLDAVIEGAKLEALNNVRSGANVLFRQSGVYPSGSAANWDEATQQWRYDPNIFNPSNLEGARQLYPSASPNREETIPTATKLLINNPRFRLPINPKNDPNLPKKLNDTGYLFGYPTQRSLVRGLLPSGVRGLLAQRRPYLLQSIAPNPIYSQYRRG